MTELSMGAGRRTIPWQLDRLHTTILCRISTPLVSWLAAPAWPARLSAITSGLDCYHQPCALEDEGTTGPQVPSAWR